MFVGGFIIDAVKTKTIIWMAFAMHLIGIVLLIISKDKTMLFVSNIFVGLANGCVEAACNPLVASMYTDNKTKMLNRFHVWFPGAYCYRWIAGDVHCKRAGPDWAYYLSLLLHTVIYSSDRQFLKQSVSLLAFRTRTC